jgi:hypothetical protein
VLRLAAVLAGIDAPEISNVSRISKVHMQNAINLTRHYLLEGLRLVNSGIADPMLQEANKLLEWFRAKKKTIVSLVEIYQYGANSIRDAKKAKQLMNVLIEHGYARPITCGVDFQGKMRKEAFEVKI